jgi:hypothetical protein
MGMQAALKQLQYASFQDPPIQRLAGCDAFDNHLPGVRRNNAEDR